MTSTVPKQKKSELLAPAGSLEKLKIAILYGADAVYAGTPDMSLRTKSSFTLEELVEGVEFAHSQGKKVYLTLNLFSHNKDIEKLPLFLETIRKVKPDGVIIADPGVFHYVKQNTPELELHISTQANICSWLSVKFWEEQGADLCVLAREVSFSELTEIREKCPDIKLEAFVHGAMCMTYSGRCLLSNFMAERGANQGNCAHDCRWKYKLKLRLKDGSLRELEVNEKNEDLFEFLLEEGNRPGELMEIEEDSRGSYIMNSRDLCLMPKLSDYLKLGIDSLKIEGRNKSPYYVALATRTYRMAIDDWYRDPENWNPKPYMKELETISNRGYTLAFHDGRLTNLAHNYDDAQSLSTYEVAGIIVDIQDDTFILQVKNRLVAGDVLEFVPPYKRKLKTPSFPESSLEDSRGIHNIPEEYSETQRVSLGSPRIASDSGYDSDVILLRIYEFTEAVTGKILEKAQGGPKTKIEIPINWFDQEDAKILRKMLPIGTVVRKEKALSEEERARLEFDAATQQIEAGGKSFKTREEKKIALEKSIEEQSAERKLKTPRVGEKGCCGRGCNGCLIFWHDPIYEKARELLAKKKPGSRLDKGEKVIVD